MMKCKKQISMREYMNIQIRYLLYVCKRNNLDRLSAAEFYAPKMAEKIRSKYDVCN